MKSPLSRHRIILIIVLMMSFFSSCSSSKRIFQQKKAAEFKTQSLHAEKVLTEMDMRHLPDCVKNYLVFTCAVGRSIPQNVCIEFDARMYQKPGDQPMPSNSVQYNFFDRFSRLFLMKARKSGISFRALHIYSDEQASFRVRVAGLFNVVDMKGPELTKAETVTLLNDLCLFAPACLIDHRLSWEEQSALSAKVSLINGEYAVSAILYFDESGALIDFMSDDRSALQDDGSMKQLRWTTPVTDYQEFDGRKIPTMGSTIWHYPEGAFTYGEFRLKRIRYNVNE